MVSISAMLHFLVDGLCISCMYTVAYPFDMPRLATVFMTYNVLAFLTQPLTGAIADKARNGQWMLWAAVALLSMAVVAANIATLGNATTDDAVAIGSMATADSAGTLRPSWTMLMVVASLLGMGNSLFHVWGGRLTAVSTGNDIRALGVFVATGALGLSVGMLLYSWTTVSIMLVLLVGLAAMETKSLNSLTPSPSPRRESLTPAREVGGEAVGLLVLIMLFVMLRSFVGSIFTGGLGKTETIVLAIGLVAMLGKMGGGWIAKGVGLWRGAVLMVLVTAGCLLLQQWGTPVLFIGLFAINCTMPVTLYLANVLLEGHEGLAFGLLAATLMPGYLMAML